MDLIARFLSGMTVGPFHNLLELLSLAPERLIASLILLAALILMNDFVRTALMVEYTRSVVTHVIINVLTLLPAVILGVVLLYAGYRYPERAWFNLGVAAAFYVVWYIGGTLTRLARHDTEGADIGWMSHGLFITIPCGFLAVILF
ncbi:MAG: hypothetical protein HY710_08995 [Candidatus Latescibacteria bacterium]|nr:hypothetical protein [Candidatus Latescibacterota bacterium]